MFDRKQFDNNFNLTHHTTLCGQDSIQKVIMEEKWIEKEKVAQIHTWIHKSDIYLFMYLFISLQSQY